MKKEYEIEDKIKEKLIDRGFNCDVIRNNRGLIGATIIETLQLASKDKSITAKDFKDCPSK